MANRFWVGGTGTWDASDTTHWASSSGGAGGQSVPTTGDAVTFDGSSGGGTVTVNATISLGAAGTLTCGAFTGTLTFATNNNNVTVGSFSLSGSGTRTINLGNGTWTLNGTSGTVLDCGTETNLTLNANSSTVVVSASAVFPRTIIWGTKTLNSVTIANTGNNPFAIDLYHGDFTIGTLTLTPPLVVREQSGSTLTVTNAVSWGGGSASSVVTLAAFGGGGPTIVLAGGSTATWCAIGGCTFTGSPTATNSFDLKGNSGITITGPSSGGGKIIGG